MGKEKARNEERRGSIRGKEEEEEGTKKEKKERWRGRNDQGRNEEGI